MPLVLLIAGIAAVSATLMATVRVRHPAALSMVVMAVGWLTGELALVHLALQVMVTAVLIALGALEGTAGWVGLAAMAVSWIGLVRVQSMARRARPELADPRGCLGAREEGAAGSGDDARDVARRLGLCGRRVSVGQGTSLPGAHRRHRVRGRVVHANISDHGGDSSFVAVSGNSAGGHLASLVALDPESRYLVDACVPVYGAFDSPITSTSVGTPGCGPSSRRWRCR